MTLVLAFFDGFYTLNGMENGSSYSSWSPGPFIQTLPHLLNVIFHAFDCACWFFPNAERRKQHALSVAIHRRHYLFLKVLLKLLVLSYCPIEVRHLEFLFSVLFNVVSLLLSSSESFNFSNSLIVACLDASYPCTLVL